MNRTSLATATRALAAGIVALGAALMLAGTGQAAGPARPAARGNWLNTASVTPQGNHVLGNPAAPVRLVQFVSYTCPHCATFETQSEGELKLGMIATGKGAVEVRNFVRDPVDMTVALITNCATPIRFFALHTAFMRNQSKWTAPLSAVSPAQQQRWTTGPFASRTRAIASDLKLYDFMASRGMDRATMDRCLANEALANRLAAATDTAVEKLGVPGTPSFMLDDVLLAGTHDWQSLRPQLLVRTK